MPCAIDALAGATVMDWRVTCPLGGGVEVEVFDELPPQPTRRIRFVNSRTGSSLRILGITSENNRKFRKAKYKAAPLTNT